MELHRTIVTNNGLIHDEKDKIFSEEVASAMKTSKSNNTILKNVKRSNNLQIQEKVSACSPIYPKNNQPKNNQPKNTFDRSKSTFVDSHHPESTTLPVSSQQPYETSASLLSDLEPYDFPGSQVLQPICYSNANSSCLQAATYTDLTQSNAPSRSYWTELKNRSTVLPETTSSKLNLQVPKFQPNSAESSEKSIILRKELAVDENCRESESDISDSESEENECGIVFHGKGIIN